ncbi:MAG: FHA domain-containing protein [Acidobacteria bacterium]|nr:FHA domain-containing protein [Acidobacteriota bacterium]
MGVENVPRTNPMNNPEEWIEQVIAELSSAEPAESAEEQAAEQAAAEAVKQVQQQAGELGADIARESIVRESIVKESIVREPRVALGEASGDLDVWPAKPAQQPEPAVSPAPAVAAIAEATDSAVIPGVTPDRISDSEEAKLRLARLRKMPLPKGLFAHFLLIDIRAPVREMRGIPRYLRLEACCTVIGRHAGARIFLDDDKTVKPLHARLLYEQREKSAEFVLYPLEDAPVLVNGKEIASGGVVCNSGDGVQIGSAHLIFFAKNTFAKNTAKSAGVQTG